MTSQHNSCTGSIPGAVAVVITTVSRGVSVPSGTRPLYTGYATGTGALECPGSMVRCGVHKWESTDLAHAQTHPNDAPKLGVASSGNVTLECCSEQDHNTNTYGTFLIRIEQHSIQYYN